MAELSTHQDHRRRRSAGTWRRLPPAVTAGSAVAVAGTEVIYLLARATGLINEGVVLPSILEMGPLSAASVAVTALMAVVGGGIVLAIVTALSGRPALHFRIVATVLGALSLAMPATIPGPTLGMRAAMGAMHVAVWAACVSVVARAGRVVNEGYRDE